MTVACVSKWTSKRTFGCHPLQTREEVAELEHAFIESYNALAFRSCDGNFRRITGVSLLVDPNKETIRNNRILQDVNNTNGTTFFLNPNTTAAATAQTSEVVPVLFEVTGQSINRNAIV